MQFTIVGRVIPVPALPVFRGALSPVSSRVGQARFERRPTTTKHRELLADRRGEAPLVPPDIQSGPKQAMALPRGPRLTMRQCITPFSPCSRSSVRPDDDNVKMEPALLPLPRLLAFLYTNSLRCRPLADLA